MPLSASPTLITSLLPPLFKVVRYVQKRQNVNFGPMNFIDQAVALHEKARECFDFPVLVPFALAHSASSMMPLHQGRPSEAAEQRLESLVRCSRRPRQALFGPEGSRLLHFGHEPFAAKLFSNLLL